MIYLLLAAYNEENDLPRLLEEILVQRWQWPYTIVIVNDGSTDKTRENAEGFLSKLPLSIINRPENGGLGAALGTGYNALREKITADDMLITMDADDTHPVTLLPSIKEKLETGTDIVIASRFCTGGIQYGLKWSRRLLSRGASIVMRILWPVKGITDYTSGYRGFSGTIISKLSKAYGESLIEESGFAATLELLLKASTRTASIAEVPLALHYEKKTGPSKMNVAATLRQYLRLLRTLKK